MPPFNFSMRVPKDQVPDLQELRKQIEGKFLAVEKKGEPDLIIWIEEESDMVVIKLMLNYDK